MKELNLKIVIFLKISKGIELIFIKKNLENYIFITSKMKIINLCYIKFHTF